MHLLSNSLVLSVLFFLSGFFSATETALFSLSKLEKRRLATDYGVVGKWIIQSLENPQRTLGTILIGNLLVNTLAAAVAALIALEYAGKARLGYVMAVFTIILIFFCEILPKVSAVRNNQKIALSTAIPLRVFSFILFPVWYCLQAITDAVLKNIGRGKKDAVDAYSAEELKTMVKIGEEDGVIDRQERRMIQKLFELGERPVRQIMTPRIDLAALDVDDPTDRHIEMIRKYHFSHFPVYKETVDHILGVVSVQEYMLSRLRDIKSIIKQPLFVPETKRIDNLLDEFRKTNKNFAVCVDEYGGTAGVATLEDILEEIFGEFYDEYAQTENPIRYVGRQEYIVDGKIALQDFNENFSTHLKAQEATTLAGFILEHLGEVPAKDKVLQLPECEMRIHDMIRQRIRSVIVKKAG